MWNSHCLRATSEAELLAAITAAGMVDEEGAPAPDGDDYALVITGEQVDGFRALLRVRDMPMPAALQAFVAPPLDPPEMVWA